MTVALRMGARVLMPPCDVRAAWRRHGCRVIILVFDAEAADTRNCFHALLPCVKGAGRRSVRVDRVIYCAPRVRACRLGRGGCFTQRRHSDEQRGGQDWQAHRCPPQFDFGLPISHPMRPSLPAPYASAAARSLSRMRGRVGKGMRAMKNAGQRAARRHCHSAFRHQPRDPS